MKNTFNYKYKVFEDKKWKIFFILTLIISCSNSEKIKESLALLQSSTIIFPKQSPITIQGRDTLIANFLESELKLVIYTDSIECQSCVIGIMHKWNYIIEYAKSLNGKLKCYFIFAPKHSNINNMRNNLSNIIFNYPILIDTLGEFERLNPHLPKNKTMHTFLLDENNNVILVGNPLHNKEIEKLFYKKTQELLSK